MSVAWYVWVVSMLVVAVTMILMSLFAMWRGGRLEQEMRGRAFSGETAFTVSYTGKKVYGMLAWGSLTLTAGVAQLVVSLFFPYLDPDTDDYSGEPFGVAMLMMALLFLAVLWVRTGTRLTVLGDQVVLARCHRIHRLDAADLVSVEVLHGDRNSGQAKGLCLGFRYPGASRIHSVTFWQGTTHYADLHDWLADHGHGTDEQTSESDGDFA